MTHAQKLCDLNYVINLQPATCGQCSFAFDSAVTPGQVLARWSVQSGDRVVFWIGGPSTQEVDEQTLAMFVDIVIADRELEARDKRKIRELLSDAYKWAKDVAMTTMEVGPAAMKPNPPPTLEADLNRIERDRQANADAAMATISEASGQGI